MEVTRTYSELTNTYNYEIKEDNKVLKILYQANYDLYFSIHGKDINDYVNPCEFNITKENIDVYNLFSKLYDDIENINLYEDDIIPIYMTEEEYKKQQEDEKRRYKSLNKSNYNDLFNNNTITWYSDETSYDIANILKIKKEEEMFKIEFSTQPYIDEFERDFNSNHYIVVRVSNSGSKYEPFNMCFMKLYNNLQKYDPENQIKEEHKVLIKNK